MKIFVINLERRPDRLLEIDSQLKKLGLDYQRISAVDGSKLDSNFSEVDRQQFRLNQRRDIGTGEIGCAESHKKVWRCMLNSHIEQALVLEDDALLDEKIVTLLSSEKIRCFDFVNLSEISPYAVNSDSLQTLVENNIWERPYFFQLGKRRIWRKIGWNKNWKRIYKNFFWRIFRLHQIEKNMFLLECDPVPMSSSSYIISQNAAKCLLKISSPTILPIDKTWQFANGGLIEAICYPALAKQSSNVSDIAVDRKVKRRLTLTERLKRIFYKNRRYNRVVDTIMMYGIRFF